MRNAPHELHEPSDFPLRDRIQSTPTGARIWQQERSIFETTELICELMDRHGVSRSELARRLGKSKGYVTKLLDGSVNMTLRTISDVYFVLGFEYRPQAKRLPVNGPVGSDSRTSR